MKVLYLVPTRGLADPNTARERLALERLGENEVRVLAPPSGGSGGMLRRLGDVFALARAAARESPADIVVCRDLDTLRAGVRTKAAFGPPTKLVYWPHDVYEWMVEADVPPLVPNVLTRHERRLLPFIDALVASNVGVLNWTLTQRGSLPIPPVALVMPCRDPLHHDPPPESRTLCYLGTLHRNRFSVELLRAMRRIDGRLILAAPRTNELYGWVGANLPPNVEFRGTLGEAGVIAATRESDLVVSMLNPADRNLRIGLANKVFDAMSVGRAAVGTVRPVAPQPRVHDPAAAAGRIPALPHRAETAAAGNGHPADRPCGCRRQDWRPGDRGG